MARAMNDSGVEWIGEIPEGWELVRLSSVFSERKEKVSDRDFEPLSVTKQGILPQIEGVAKTDNGDSRKRVSKGDFVINSRSDRKGASGVSSYDGSVSLINIVLRPTSKVKGGYVHHLLRSYAFQEEFYRWGHGIVADLWTTNSNDAKGILLPLPEAEEQQRISDFLDVQTAEIDASIAKTQESIEEYKKLKQAVITQAVTKGIRPGRAMKDSGVEWIGEIPKEWETPKTKYIFQIKGRIGFRGYTTDDIVDEHAGAVTLSPSNIKEGKADFSSCKYISWSKYNESPEIQIKKNDIIMVKTGSSYGKSAIINHVPESMTINPQLVIMSSYTCNPNFCIYALQSLSFSAQVEGIIAGGTIPTMTQDNLGNTCIAIPAANVEQQEIATYLDEKCAAIDTLIEKKQAIITELEAYKKSLIYEYVTGKKEVPMASC